MEGILQYITLKELGLTADDDSNQLSDKVDCYTGDETDFTAYQLLVVGVCDARASEGNEGAAEAPNAIRKAFYDLFAPADNISILDLGNITAGEKVTDTRAALKLVMEEVLGHDVPMLILGGSHDLTHAQFRAYEGRDELVNMAVVDERINLNEIADDTFDSDSFLLPIFMHQPSYLFNFSHLGHQAYYTNPKAIDTLENLNFDCLRLGEIKADISEVEPLLRNADLLSIDISSIRQSDAPGHFEPSPNGLTGEEICRICRYAGFAGNLSSLGIYEYNPTYDVQQCTARLISQMAWYYLDGILNRKQEQPNLQSEDCIKYVVEMEELDHQLIFWKSKKTDRWWMQLPASNNKKYKDQQLVPCSYNDYQMAMQEELPDRWMRAYNKLF